MFMPGFRSRFFGDLIRNRARAGPGPGGVQNWNKAKAVSAPSPENEVQAFEDEFGDRSSLCVMRCEAMSRPGLSRNPEEIHGRK